MGNGFRIGRLLGIEIRLDYSWFLIFAFVWYGFTSGWLAPALPSNTPQTHLWSLGALTTVFFFVSLLLHELAHATVARMYGIPIVDITLFIFGGVARLGEEPRTPATEFVMTAVGPITSYVLAGLFGGVWALMIFLSHAAPGHVVFAYVQAPAMCLFYMNALAATFNLVPGFPLDGGRLLRAAIWHFSGNIRMATRVAASAGQVVGVLIAGTGVVLLITFGGAFLPNAVLFGVMGYFIFHLARSSYQQVLLRESLRGIAVRDVMNPEVVVIPADITVAEAVDQYFLRFRLPSFPVRSEGGPWRELTSESVRSLPRRQWPFTQVAALAHPLREDELLSPATDAWDAVLRMATRDRPRLLVVDDGQVVGIVSRGSIFQLWETRARLGL